MHVFSNTIEIRMTIDIKQLALWEGLTKAPEGNLGPPCWNVSLICVLDFHWVQRPWQLCEGLTKAPEGNLGPPCWKGSLICVLDFLWVQRPLAASLLEEEDPYFLKRFCLHTFNSRLVNQVVNGLAKGGTKSLRIFSGNPDSMTIFTFSSGVWFV